MQIQLVNNPSELQSLEATWNKLAGDNPFRQFAWAWNWWLAYQNEHRELSVLVCRDDEGHVAGIAPFALDRSLACGRRLLLLGGGEACGDGLSLLIPHGQVSTVTQAVAEWLTTGPGRGRWDLLYLDGVRSDDATLEVLSETLRPCGVSSSSRDDVAQWVVPLPSNWETYLANLGKRTRRRMRQLQTRREQLGTSYELIAAQTRADFDTLFDQLIELHNARWNNVGQKGAFGSARFEKMLRGTALTWLEQGKLVLQVLSIDGQPTAAALGVRHENVVHLYLLGRNPSFDHLQPGWMLNIELLKQAINAGCTGFDFLRGDEPYKVQLGAKRVDQQRLSFFAPGPINRLRALITTSIWSSANARHRMKERERNCSGVLSTRDRGNRAPLAGLG